MEIYYSSLPATLKTVMAKNKEKMDNNVSSHCINHIQHNKCYRLPLGHTHTSCPCDQRRLAQRG